MPNPPPLHDLTKKALGFTQGMSSETPKNCEVEGGKRQRLSPPSFKYVQSHSTPSHPKGLLSENKTWPPYRSSSRYGPPEKGK
ncbi:hypothetical protein TPY_0579 [Sulfobacillus acidophilus TPY]|nr:hypothetical protein TPY_0579 [Sulfobacillus acidophilus TPY]